MCARPNIPVHYNYDLSLKTCMFGIPWEGGEGNGMMWISIRRWVIIIIVYSPDDIYFYKSPDRLRLALIFYLGHTASMYINKLMLGGLIQVHVANPMKYNSKLFPHAETSQYAF